MRLPFVVLFLLIAVLALSNNERGHDPGVAPVKVDYDSDYARCIRQHSRLNAFECKGDSKVADDRPALEAAEVPDEFTCYGAARYQAMSEGCNCNDKPVTCSRLIPGAE